jgi:hypothetical protein
MKLSDEVERGLSNERHFTHARKPDLKNAPLQKGSTIMNVDAIYNHTAP